LTNVDVTTTNGVVTLAGIVSSEDEKQLVEEIAKTVPGVAKVHSELQVATAGTNRPGSD
jgi:osmotically-inducible protein OsmY